MEGKFQCHAAMSCGEVLKPWMYTPRSLGPHDVELSIMFCGICGSDIHGIDNQWKSSIYPLVPGHEIIGKIVKMGVSVKDFNINDVVGVGAQVDSCDDCSLCHAGNDQLCKKSTYTYSDYYQDKSISYGGYAKSVRVPCRYAFKIPQNIPLEKAAPLMCAGSTVFSPLKKFAPGPSVRVGVLGIGGLGHLALQFSKAFGHQVTAISHSNQKKDEALSLGATRFILSTDDEQMNAAIQSLDIILATSNYNQTSIDKYLTLLDKKGVFVLLAIPENQLQFSSTILVSNNLTIASSLIAPRHEIIEMLDFSSMHQVFPVIELFKMDDVPKAIEKVRNGQVHFRAVLYNEPANP